MMHQPTQLSVSENNYETVEVIDMGDHVVLMQKDETGEVNSIVLGPLAMSELRTIANMMGAR